MNSMFLLIIFKDRKNRMRHSPRYPLFEEFVRWLLCEWRAGNELDMHWTPVLQFCTPCQVRFDIIVKFETLQVTLLSILLTFLTQLQILCNIIIFKNCVLEF